MALKINSILGVLLTTLTAMVAAFHASPARGDGLYLNTESCTSLGLSFSKVKKAFQERGFSAPTEGVYLLGANSEENAIDLQSLEGHVITVDIGDIADGLSDVPRNVR